MTTIQDAARGAQTAYIVIVNWNGWRDTLQCLESVFRSSYSRYRVVVIDNGSSDGSLERIVGWAAGGVAATIDERPVLASLASPPVTKPIWHSVISREDAERGEGAVAGDVPLVLVDVSANLGFAGGCNVGLRYALRQPDCGYVWLLNNDTVVDTDALSALVRRLQLRSDAGQCGSRLLRYDRADVVETLGGEHYNKWLASIRPIGGGEPAAASADEASVEARMSYVTGASLCVTRTFVEQIGLLDESYFLYYEELDWTARSRGRFGLAYAHDSIVYHKRGASTANQDSSRRSPAADFFLLRNRLRYTWRHAPEALPTVLLGMTAAVFNRIRRRQFDRIPAILRIVSSRDSYRAS